MRFFNQPSSLAARLSVQIGRLLLLFQPFAMPAIAASIYSGGHGDMGVAWDVSQPNDFFVHAHLGIGAIVDGTPLTSDEEYLPGDVIIQVPKSSNIGRTAGVLEGSFEPYNFTGASFDFLGADVGQNLWMLMFDSADASIYGMPFLGLAAEEGFSPGDWNGALQFKLTNINGPGNLSAMTGAFSRRWDTADGSFANDVINIGPGGHSHLYLAFTHPGIYEVELTVMGAHRTFGPVTGTDTFRFQVVPEPSSLGLFAIGSVGLVGVAVRKRARRNAASL